MKSRVFVSVLLALLVLGVVAFPAFAYSEPPAGYARIVLDAGIRSTAVLTTTDVTTGLGTVLDDSNVNGLLVILVVMFLAGVVVRWIAGGGRRRR